ncbi:glucose-6-phosphate dehydrogenase assembly protein OpcA [Deinococcus sp. HSC-46F16]|uniref:glucose-6-phosphate dehydrogenase assembly protein OpcA n=1 Tax=Deinococcus sp. HSC-46F16 TaxID=2910968 RepID=UPI0020A0291F|nr:glucose-6-phosphate dehydrogenase assembly protein OpcA [Deinococcus sp. HSC-46F16]MCP2014078.1 glucose-6-phosphate dehydrogenase assembly protein OpcA [Deinococcus sp. HSC-46F16]
MTSPTDLPVLGPVETSVREAQSALDDLWAQTQVETRAYTGNIIALTVGRHLARVEEALAGLEGRYAGRQIIGVMDAPGGEVRVQVSLVPQPGGLYIERLRLSADPEGLQGAILPLLRPATVNHVWWGADTRPGGVLLSELTEIADQVIADSLTLDIPPARHYALADLGWSRSAGWREGLAQLFDSPDAARQLGRVRELEVTYVGENDLPARLFAGWVASTLGWPDLGDVTYRPGDCGRENGDLCGLELRGDGVRFTLVAAGGDLVRTGCEWPGMTRRTELNVPRMTLAEGLARVMARPERREVFERAWSLARAQLEAERGS